MVPHGTQKVSQPSIRHCFACGAPTAPSLVEGKQRARCTLCLTIAFESPRAVSAAVVVDARGRVLLVQRALEPERGKWALPAGYQDIDETAQAACQREVREETGLSIEILGLFDVLFVHHPSRPSANLTVFMACAQTGALRCGDDASAAGFFDLADLPAPIGFENQGRILDRLPGHSLFARAAHLAAAPGPRHPPRS